MMDDAGTRALREKIAAVITDNIDIPHGDEVWVAAIADRILALLAPADAAALEDMRKALGALRCEAWWMAQQLKNLGFNVQPDGCVMTAIRRANEVLAAAPERTAAQPIVDLSHTIEFADGMDDEGAATGAHKQGGDMSEWICTAERLPPEDVVVETKIDDAHGVRNEHPLKLSRNLWWFTDKSMYVYYCPTHWRIPADDADARTTRQGEGA